MVAAFCFSREYTLLTRSGQETFWIPIFAAICSMAVLAATLSNWRMMSLVVSGRPPSWQVMVMLSR